jgi:hypothetical protein
MNIENKCPVCGYEMEAPPKDYRICPSCGTEFGVNDVDATIPELRESWMKTGPRWWSKVDPMPADWEPIAQMEEAGIVVKRPSQSSAIGTSTSSRVIGSKSWEVVATGSAGRARVMECD